MSVTVIGYDWAPDEGRGQVRDMRVRWALEEVDQPYETRLLAWGDQKEAAHRARHPFGQVPAYEEDELVLFESGAIVLHIAETRPGLLPTDPAGRARAITWMFAALNTVEPVIWELIRAFLFEAREPWSAARLPSVEERVRNRLEELSTYIGDREWLDGDFSAGDLLMIHVLRGIYPSGRLAPFPALAAYVERGEARPAFGRALTRFKAELTGEPPAWWAQFKGENA